MIISANRNESAISASLGMGALSMSLNRDGRPWWVRLLILITGPAILLILVLIVFAVWERGGERALTTEEWSAAVGEVFEYYTLGYVAPVAMVQGRNPNCNQKSQLTDIAEDCEAVVQRLRDHSGKLTRAADRFDYLAARAPPEIPMEWKQELYDVSEILRSTRDADMLIVRGWSERDQEQWQLGWRQKGEADDDFRSLSRRSSLGETP
jgi:hypothetical protein